MVIAFVVLLGLTVGSPSAEARQAPGSIQGTVSDTSGAVVAGVTVTLFDDAGKAILETQTADAGTFVLEPVPPGTFVLRAVFPGFDPHESPASVTAGRRTSLPKIVLTVAGMQEDVTVRREEAAVSGAADANRDAVVIKGDELRDIPVFDRDVVATVSRFLDAGSLGADGGATLVVDGMEASTVGVSPSAIQEIKVNQDPYAAEFQRPGRGRIEVITKAGSDAYHGSFDFTFRDAALNARDAFAPTKPPEQRRIYEGVLGGPIFDGKQTSFLVTLERRDEDLQSIVFAATPGGTVNAVVPRPSRNTELSASWTHLARGNQTMTVRFTGEHQTRLNDGVGGTTLPEAGTDSTSNEAQVVFSHRWIASAKAISEFRLLAGSESSATVSLSPGVRIVVPDAFTAGGAQADQRTTEDHIQLTENLTYLAGRHLLKAGFAIPDLSRRGFDDRTIEDGVFTFASPDDYSAGNPLSFVQQRGDGRMVFLQQVYAAFVQDQVSLRRDLTVAFGLRYDWQNIFVDNNNIAPRVSFAYGPRARTVVRGGVGWFYDRAGDGPIRDVLRSRQDTLFRYLLLQPEYPDPFGGDGPATVPPQAVVRLAPDTNIPYVIQYSIGVERQVRDGLTLSASYVEGDGVDLFRSRNVNAPPPPLYDAPPDPAYSSIRQIESSGRQHTRSLQVAARGHFVKRLQGTVQYSFGRAYNDTSGINALPANNYDLTGEYGRADFDQRHHLELVAQFDGGPWLRLGAAVSAGSGYSVLPAHRAGRLQYRPDQRPPAGRREEYSRGTSVCGARSAVVAPVSLRAGTTRRTTRLPHRGRRVQRDQPRQSQQRGRESQLAVFRGIHLGAPAAAHPAVGQHRLLRRRRTIYLSASPQLHPRATVASSSEASMEAVRRTPLLFDVGTLWTMERDGHSACCTLRWSPSGWEVGIRIDRRPLLAKRCRTQDDISSLASLWCRKLRECGWLEPLVA